MSRIITTLAQFIFILWPLFIVTGLIYSLQVTPPARKGRLKIGRALKNLLQRIRRNLLITWTILLFFWFIALFASGPTPGLIPEPWNTTVFLGGFAFLVLSEATELGLFKRRLRAHVDLHRAHELQDLKLMDPTGFEIMVSETYRMLGYKVQHIGQSGDHGVDVELRTKSGEYWIVQCKRYKSSVGESTVRELYGTMVAENADRAVLVTTAKITPPARAWARGKPIDLIDGAALLFLIDRARRMMENSWFDRLALSLEDFLQPSRPPALRVAKFNGSAGEQDLENSIDIMNDPERITYVRGVPVCPDCGVLMQPRPTRPDNRPGRTLYRCVNYPDCRVVLEPETTGARSYSLDKANESD